jgi:hypothetical protein
VVLVEGRTAIAFSSLVSRGRLALTTVTSTIYPPMARKPYSATIAWKRADIGAVTADAAGVVRADGGAEDDSHHLLGPPGDQQVCQRRGGAVGVAVQRETDRPLTAALAPADLGDGRAGGPAVTAVGSGVPHGARLNPGLARHERSPSRGAGPGDLVSPGRPASTGPAGYPG